MGEWSKSIGEKGEKIVKFVFEEILEFNSLIENTSIECNKGEQHKDKKAKKNKSGLWAGKFMFPWNWRKQNR